MTPFDTPADVHSETFSGCNPFANESAPTDAHGLVPLEFEDEPESVIEILRSLAESAFAEEFVRTHRLTLRVAGDVWMLWAPVTCDEVGSIVSGGYWPPLHTDDKVARLVQETVMAAVRKLHAEADWLRWRTEQRRGNESDARDAGALDRAADRIQRNSYLRAVTSIVKRHPDIQMEMSQFDAEPYLLNVANGLVDLRTGLLRAHDREAFLTHRVRHAFNPELLDDADAACPTWIKVLTDVCCGDASMVRFLQRAVGMTITADTSAQVLLFLYGTGANGKSTVTNVLADLLGSGLYQRIRAVSLMRSARDGSSATPDIAKLRGARLALATELPDSRFDEATIKDVVGDDDITARFLNRNPVTFKPSHTLWMHGNHRPAIVGTDAGIWRRIILIPFEARFEGSDIIPDLNGRLAAEMPGILAWAVKGCLEWQAAGAGKVGLGTCETIERATAEYREQTDVIGTFLAEMCDVGPEYEVNATELYETYSSWTVTQGVGTRSAQFFGSELTTRGFKSRKSSCIYRMGLKVKDGVYSGRHLPAW